MQNPSESLEILRNERRCDCGEPNVLGTLIDRLSKSERSVTTADRLCTTESPECFGLSAVWTRCGANRPQTTRSRRVAA